MDKRLINFGGTPILLQPNSHQVQGHKTLAIEVESYPTGGVLTDLDGNDIGYIHFKDNFPEHQWRSMPEFERIRADELRPGDFVLFLGEDPNLSKKVLGVKLAEDEYDSEVMIWLAGQHGLHITMASMDTVTINKRVS